MTTREHTASRVRVGRHARTASAILAAAGVVAVADLASSYLVLAALFGSPSLLWGLVLVGAVTSAVIVVFTRALTGRLSIAGPIAVTVTAGAAGGWAFVTGNLPVMHAEPATPIAHVLICLASGLVLGLFIGPGEFRIAGGSAAVGLVVYAAIIAPPAPEVYRPPANGDPAHREAMFEEFLGTAIPPLVTDRSGWEVTGTWSSGATSTSEIVSPDGGVVVIVVDQTPADAKWDADAHTCWQLVDRSSIPDSTTTFADWSGRCAITDDGWEALDGSGFAWQQKESIVLAIATDPLHTSEGVGTRPATPDEIDEVRSDLRPMNDAEMREHFADEYLGPVEYR